MGIECRKKQRYQVKYSIGIGITLWVLVLSFFLNDTQPYFLPSCFHPDPLLRLSLLSSAHYHEDGYFTLCAALGSLHGKPANIEFKLVWINGIQLAIRSTVGPFALMPAIWYFFPLSFFFCLGILKSLY